MTPNTDNTLHKNWTLFAVCLGTFMLLVDVTIVVVALPSIRASLHTSFSDVQWTIDAYSLTLASLLLPFGSLGDILGRRRVFAGGLTVFTLGSLLCGALELGHRCWSSVRAFQGIGGATIFATPLALLAQTFTGKERGFAFGIWGAVAGAADRHRTAARRTAHHRPQLALDLLREPADRRPRDRCHAARACEEFRAARRPAGSTCPASSSSPPACSPGLRPDRVGPRGWGSTHVIVALDRFGGCCSPRSRLIERSAREPMFDLRLFRKPTFVGGSIAALRDERLALTRCSCTSRSTCRTAQHFSPLQAGLRLAIITFAIDGHRDSSRRELATGAGALADRTRTAARRGRPAADARALTAHSDWTAPAARIHRRRRRRRAREPTARLNRDRRGRPTGRGHGLGDQHDIPPGRDRDRGCGSRLDLRPWPGRRNAGHAAHRLRVDAE